MPWRLAHSSDELTSKNTMASSLSPTKIAIFYPKAKEPYKSIYQEIIAGSQNQANNKSTPILFEHMTINKGFDSNKIAKQLKMQGISKVIVLGRLGWQLANDFIEFKENDGSPSFQTVSGALPISPGNISGVSLITAPTALFSYLQQVAPKVKKIHVAYSKRNAWLLDLAKATAKEKNLTLQAVQVNTTKQAVQYYQQLFQTKLTQTDAIWLPLDRVSSNDKVTLPFILEKSWSKEVVVFSSKPSHAKRGVLFSTYPNNLALGEELLDMLLKLDNQPNQKSFAAIESTRLAVNLRTAAHLGIKYNRQQKNSFQLTFPK